MILQEPMGEKEKTAARIWDMYEFFFEGRDQAMKICALMPDWREYGQDRWEQEYDDLFCGTDCGRVVPLWASASRGETILLDRTTLDVIRFYHEFGYEPVWIQGNPPDFLGEQLRFLSYLSAAMEGNPKDIPLLSEARERFLQEYFYDTAQMAADAVTCKTVVPGFGRLFQGLLRFLADDLTADEELCGLAGRWAGRYFDDWEPFGEVRVSGRRESLPTEEPHVIPTAGINNCGGICVIRPEVAENCMLNIQTDCSENDPQLRACVRGRGYRKTYLHSERLRYPMRRIGPRGSGRFRRISWEEAVDLMADNWKRIRGQYGPSSSYVIYATGVKGVMRPTKLIGRLLNLDGGYLEHFNSYSSACASYTAPYLFGTGACGNSLSDLLNTKLLVLWGDNPVETVFGTERGYYLSRLKEKGIRMIVIDPRMSQTAVAYGDEWIAPRPSTDAALADAMAYVIWTEGLKNQEFMDRYCLGFDEEHMPEGVPKEACYRAYLFGETDGIPKTPQWAEKITGVDAETIRRIAREYGGTRPACIVSGLGPQRHGNGEQTTRGIALLACLTGNIGIPGGGTGVWGDPKEHQGIALFNDRELQNPYPGKIPVFLWTKAIEHGMEMTPRGDRLKGVERLDSNIKMIFNLAGNTLINQHSDIHDTIRILEDDTKCEFIVTSDIFMTPSARYSDLVLPATSVFEGENIVKPWRGNNYLLKNNQVIRPLFEARFEWEWMKELAGKLGLYEAFVDGKPELGQWLRENYEVLRRQEPELPDYDTFSERGGWQYREQAGWIAFEREIREPDRYPFATPSGKIEIFSKRLYDFRQDDIPAIPGYRPCPEGPEDKLREKYPLQLIGWHTRRRCHSTHDNNEWQDEVELPGLWIHPADAEARGIAAGDMVKIWNDRGCIKIPAVVTARIRTGVVAMSQGGWFTPDENGTEIRGSINVLTSAAHPTPLAKGNPQHTNLVQVERA